MNLFTTRHRRASGANDSLVSETRVFDRSLGYLTFLQSYIKIFKKLQSANRHRHSILHSQAWGDNLAVLLYCCMALNLENIFALLRKMTKLSDERTPLYVLTWERSYVVLVQFQSQVILT